MTDLRLFLRDFEKMVDEYNLLEKILRKVKKVRPSKIERIDSDYSVDFGRGLDISLDLIPTHGFGDGPVNDHISLKVSTPGNHFSFCSCGHDNPEGYREMLKESVRRIYYAVDKRYYQRRRRK